MLVASVPGIAADGLEFETPQVGDVPLGETLFSFRVTTSLERVDIYGGGRLLGAARAPRWEAVIDVPSDLVGSNFAAIGYFAGRPVARAILKTRRIRISDEVDVVRVQLFPVVRTLGGSYVSDLKRDDFEIFDDGARTEIRTFEQRARDLSIAIVLDISESMTLALHTLQEAACDFVDRLDEDDRVAVYSFNDALTPVTPLSTDREEVKSRIRSLKAGGSTALYDAMVRVIESFDGVDGRKVLLVFSDGRDMTSISSADRVVRLARQSEALLYTIGPSAGEMDDLRDVLQFIAQETGGEAYFINSPRAFSRVFERVIGHLRAQYELTFVPRPGEDGLRTVKVEVRRPGLSARARQSYYHKSREER